MSDTHGPQGYAPEQAAAPKKMTTFLKVSIILLIGLTLASISLLFIGDFEGRFERVFSTFALFAVFVVLTAIDTSREKRNEWYAPVALIANTYILGLLLIVIWMTSYDPFSLMFEIVWKSILVIVITRLVIVCCEVLLRSGEKTGGVSVLFSFITSVLAVISGILFTAPWGLEAFDLRVPDLYWKIATSVLILTALGLSITLLLRWSSKSDARSARRAAVGAYPAAGQPYIAGPANYGTAAFPQQPTGQQMPQPFPQVQLPAVPQVPHGGTQPSMGQPGVDQPGVDQPGVDQSVTGRQGVAEPSSDQGGLLPWPTFADGRPIPAGADGQPDFTVPGAPLPPQG